MINQLKRRGREAVTSRLDLEPIKIVWTQGSITGAENLLKKRERQISMLSHDSTVMESDEEMASIILDFGCELHGGIRISVWDVSDKSGTKVRIRFGESVSETMSEIGADTNATNDHARRDIITEVGMMSMNPIGETGFRFVRIDLLEKGMLELKSVLAEFVYKDVPYRGSFQCNDELLNRIWMTGAYTMHLNMQEFVWDGIKRDRLVWIADMHPEIKTIMSVFGDDDSVKKSLDFIRNETPLPGWMNNIATYSMWYVVILYDWYLYTGDSEWINEQRAYLKGLLKQFQGIIGEDGKYLLDKYQCFVDWPSCEHPEIVDAGMKAIHFMALEGLEKMFVVLQEYDKQQNKQMEEYQELESLRMICVEERELLRKYERDYQGSKSAAALCALTGLADAQTVNEELLGKDGAERVSTYMGYYILSAMSQNGDINGALECAKEYWGGMLSLGATTFWEDFDVAWLKNAAPIDRLPNDGEIDVHKTYGKFCYTGYRHSLCHGWASGPTSWMTEEILGVKILEPGCRKLQITPNLGKLEWAEGVFPTPLGDVSIKVQRDANGETTVDVKAPEGVIIVGKEERE